MRIKIENYLLADPAPAVGRIGPSGLVLNGRELLDEAEFFRAAAPTYFDRGSAGVSFQFSVDRLFATLGAAEAFALVHPTSVPKAGLITCECDPDGAAQTVYLRNAIIESAQCTNQRGLSVTTQYSVRGSGFETDVPPEDIPGDADTGEGEFVVLRRGKVAIGAGDTSVAVVFSTPLSAVPAVTPHCAAPSGSPIVTAHLRQDTVTINGFEVELSAATPDGTYVLHYTAIE